MRQSVKPSKKLAVPESLQPSPERQLPLLDMNVLQELSEAGWKRVGIMVAVVDSVNDILMLNHNGRGKNGHGVLGPLGETSQSSGPIIEQPLETLYRGMREELGEERPDTMALRIHRIGGWVINQWPVGTAHPGEFACAISFPVFINDAVRAALHARNLGTKEVAGAQFMSVEQIESCDPEDLRPGVHEWLGAIVDSGLLESGESALTTVDFTSLYATSLQDIEL